MPCALAISSEAKTRESQERSPPSPLRVGGQGTRIEPEIAPIFGVQSRNNVRTPRREPRSSRQVLRSHRRRRPGDRPRVRSARQLRRSDRKNRRWKERLRGEDPPKGRVGLRRGQASRARFRSDPRSRPSSRSRSRRARRTRPPSRGKGRSKGRRCPPSRRERRPYPQSRPPSERSRREDGTFASHQAREFSREGPAGTSPSSSFASARARSASRASGQPVDLVRQRSVARRWLRGPLRGQPQRERGRSLRPRAPRSRDGRGR
jgi:hypothetical protein